MGQNHPAASGGNAGTDEAAPLKTIQRGADLVGPGDTVLIKAGVYRECVMVRTSGTYSAATTSMGWHLANRILISAYGDDPVVIDGSTNVPSAAWTPVDGRTNVYVATVQTESGGLTHPPRGVTTAFWNGTRLPWAAAIPPASQTNTWWYDNTAKLLYVNLGGADPRAGGTVEASVRPYGITIRNRQFITLRKLTVRREGWRAIEAGPAVEPIVEDCEVYDSESGIHVGVALRPMVRRCRARATSSAWGAPRTRAWPISAMQPAMRRWASSRTTSTLTRWAWRGSGLTGWTSAASVSL
jgi:hypothetical protein